MSGSHISPNSSPSVFFCSGLLGTRVSEKASHLILLQLSHAFPAPSRSPSFCKKNLHQVLESISILNQIYLFGVGMERAVVVVVQNTVSVSIRVTRVTELGIRVATFYLPRLHQSPPDQSWAHPGNCPLSNSRRCKPALRPPIHRHPHPHHNVSLGLQSLVWCKWWGIVGRYLQAQ